MASSTQTDRAVSPLAASIAAALGSLTRTGMTTRLPSGVRSRAIESVYAYTDCMDDAIMSLTEQECRAALLLLAGGDETGRVLVAQAVGRVLAQTRPQEGGQ
jgi:hypothetical protein